MIKQIGENDVECEVRKLPEFGPAYLCGLGSIKRRQVMGDIVNGKKRIDFQQLSFYTANKKIPVAYIGRKCNQRHG